MGLKTWQHLHQHLSLQQERQLVYAIYGRADAWLRWRDRTRHPLIEDPVYLLS